tara:strand:- start:6307 stop:7266 length:960 start_codon:yes stop_codon:yes gene_type:complete
LNNNLNLWTITDGSQGMISQVNGLAQFMNNKFTEKKIKLKWPWSILQPGFIPFNKKIFEKNFFEDSLPNMIISCGRKSVYASIYLKKQLRNKIINIHIQNPKINPKNFDYIISPNHDKLNGVNIINSTGALHHLTKNKIESASKIFDVPNNKKIVAIILGGENNHYHFNDKILNSFLDKIQNLNKVNEKYFFLFIPSRRTDNNLIKIIKNRFNLNHYVWDKVSENPYLYALKIADIFIVSSDSTSMISEASFTSKPLHIFHLPFKRKSERIERFHKEFEEKGITKPFKEELFYWSYEPLKESERIAGILSSRILKQKNE